MEPERDPGMHESFMLKLITSVSNYLDLCLAVREAKLLADVRDFFGENSQVHTRDP